MNTLADRLKLAREQAGLTQKELADRAHTGQSTVASIERGRNSGSTLLTKFAMILHVEPLWLAEGRGPMRRTGEPPAPYRVKTVEPSEDLNVDEHTQRLITLYNALPESDQQSLLNALEEKVSHYDALMAELLRKRPPPGS